MSDDERRPGRPKGIETRPYRVLLPEELAEWAKVSVHGLSGLLRRLLSEEKARQDAETKPFPAVRRHPHRG